MVTDFSVSLDEAKQKSCPMTFSIPNAAFTCIGKNCMAWRFVEKPVPDPKGSGGYVLSVDTHGYCGMAS